MNIPKHLIAAIILLLAPFSVWSATYYISNSQGNDSWSGTLDAPNATSTDGPKQTLSNANSLIRSANPGDQILFKRGDLWTGQMNQAGFGTIAEPIIVGAYGVGNKPIFTTSNDTVGILIGSGQYTTFDGLEFYSTSSMNNRNYAISFPATGSANHINFNDCYFHDYDHGGALYTNDYGTIENSIIEDMGRTSAHSQGLYIANDNFTLRSSTLINNGIYDSVGFDHSVYASNATNLLIEDNIMRDAVDGIKIRRGRNVTARGNLIYNMHMGGVSVGGDLNGGFDTALIEGNRIFNCPDPILTLSQSGSQSANTDNVTIKDNIVYSSFGQDTIPSYKGIISITGAPHTNVRIYNNTIFNNRMTSRNDVSRAISIEASNMANSMIKNNIIYNEKTSVPMLFISNTSIHSNIDIENNFYVDKGLGTYITVGSTNYSSVSAYNAAYPLQEQSGIQGDHQLIDPFNSAEALRDFKVLKDAPNIIDKGEFISIIEDDYAGVDRGQTPDIGAYQYANPPAPPVFTIN